MAEPVRISDRDMRALLRMVTGEREHDVARGLPLSLLGDLNEQIPCDTLSFFGLNSGGSRLVQPGPARRPGARRSGILGALLGLRAVLLPRPQRRSSSVTTISDFYSSRQWHSTGMYRDYLRWVEHEIMVCLPGGPGQSVRLVFFRGSGPDFSERDRALLTLLRPHLHEAFLDAERRRRGIPDLTARQWDLLRLVAAGATNAQIARRLGISEGTVRTHMENIFARLQVSSRTAAITRAFPDRATLLMGT